VLAIVITKALLEGRPCPQRRAHRTSIKATLEPPDQLLSRLATPQPYHVDCCLLFCFLLPSTYHHLFPPSLRILLPELGLNPRPLATSFTEALSSPLSVVTSQRGELLTQYPTGSCLVESCFIHPHITTHNIYSIKLLSPSATSLPGACSS
jgi:hypothetical protein